MELEDPQQQETGDELQFHPAWQGAWPRLLRLACRRLTVRSQSPTQQPRALCLTAHPGSVACARRLGAPPECLHVQTREPRFRNLSVEDALSLALQLRVVSHGPHNKSSLGARTWANKAPT